MASLVLMYVANSLVFTLTIDGRSYQSTAKDVQRILRLGRNPTLKQVST